MANSSDTKRSRGTDGAPADWAAGAGWGALTLGILGVVLYGISVATPWSLSDPLGLSANQPAAMSPHFQRALDDALDQAWRLLGGHGGGVLFAELTQDPDRMKRAGQLIDGVLASRPGDSRAFVLQGLLHLAADRPDAARRSLERSLEVGGGHQSLLVLSALHTQVGELDEAEVVLRRAVEQYPSSPSAWNNLGHVLSQQGRQDEADEAFRRYEELTTGQVTSVETPAAEGGDR